MCMNTTDLHTIAVSSICSFLKDEARGGGRCRSCRGVWYLSIVVLMICKLTLSSMNEYMQKTNKNTSWESKSIHCVMKPIRMQLKCPYNSSYQSKKYPCVAFFVPFYWILACELECDINFQCWVDYFKKCTPLLIPNYMEKIAVSNTIHYITHLR